MPADDRCLYHCGVACRDLRGWWQSHDSVTGLAANKETQDRDIRAAEDVKIGVILAASQAGEEATVDRLRLAGSAGTPGQEEIVFLAKHLGGQVVMQMGRNQELHGQGPRVAHLSWVLTKDGAGHQSGHFVVLQSWMPPLRAPKRTIPVVAPPAGTSPKFRRVRSASSDFYSAGGTGAGDESFADETVDSVAAGATAAQEEPARAAGWVQAEPLRAGAGAQAMPKAASGAAGRAPAEPLRAGAGAPATPQAADQAAAPTRLDHVQPGESRSRGRQSCSGLRRRQRRLLPRRLRSQCRWV